MTTDPLREAAAEIRADYPDRERAPFENAVADWLLRCRYRDNDDVLDAPDWPSAVEVARAYLQSQGGEPTP